MTDRKLLDIALLILFFVGMSSNFFSAEVHELCGVIFIGAVFVHNFFNRQFYRNFATRRTTNKICTVAFAAALIVLTISGAMLWSGATNFNWRSIHLGAAISSLIILSWHLLIHARRYIHGKIFSAAAATAFVLAVAGIFGLPYMDRWFHKVAVDSEKIIHGEKISSDEKFLTVYFSRVGNTNFPADVDAVSGASLMRDGEELIGNAQMIARMAQDIVGGDLLEIQTEKIYPANYSATTQVAKVELAGDDLPRIKKLPQLERYDKIILIYPLWWSTLPKAVESFLRGGDLRGKIIIPIVTHGGGGIGNSVDVLQSVTPAKVVAPLDIYSSDVPASREKIFNHLKNFS